MYSVALQTFTAIQAKLYCPLWHAFEAVREVSEPF